MVQEQLLEQFKYQFDENLIKDISKEGVLRTFETNAMIMDIGQDFTHVPLLLEGNIKVLREDADGSELLLYILETGDTCAMSLTCCLAKTKSRIRAVADKTTTVVMIPNEKIKEWFNINESWRNFILQSYQTRFNEMLETIDTLAFMNMDERLFKYLNATVKLNASKIISKTHQEIAEDLNTSRVVISRLLKQLQIKQKIRLSRNKIEFLDF